MLRGVIFDVDGTLLDTEKIYIQAWREAGKCFGYQIPDEALMRTRAINRQRAIEIFKEYLGPDFCYEKLLPERIRIAEELINQSANLLKPGVNELLDTLDTRGIRLAVASSTNLEKTKAHLTHAGLLHRFHGVVGGDMIEKGKPNPDIFLLAASLLGLHPEECIVVEDSPAGIEAAFRGGFRGILIPDCVPANDKTAAMSYRVMRDLYELIDILEEF